MAGEPIARIDCYVKAVRVDDGTAKVCDCGRDMVQAVVTRLDADGVSETPAGWMCGPCSEIAPILDVKE